MRKKPTPAKLVIATISPSEARAAKIDRAKVEATSGADIARHWRHDLTETPPHRTWKRMMRDGDVLLVPPADVDVRGIREKLHLSRAAFAAWFGFTATAVTLKDPRAYC